MKQGRGGKLPTFPAQAKHVFKHSYFAAYFAGPELAVAARGARLLLSRM